jgi:arylsulfatase A-like enzyme
VTKRPHLIIFNPDQYYGGILGHMGDPAAVSPNLDQLVARDAVSFRHAYCQNPVCTPSRCSFMTGWYPHVRGHRAMHHMLQPDEPMLLRTLKDAGYRVWWGGKNDVVPAQNGFTDYCDVKYQPPADRPLPPDPHTVEAWRGDSDGDNYYSFYYGRIAKAPGEDFAYDRDWAMVEGAVDLIRHAPADQPLCIYLPLSFPHPPYAVEDPWYSLIDRAKIPPRIQPPADWSGKPALLKGLVDLQGLSGWSEARWTELRAVYYGMCARIDAQFGMVLDALHESGLYDDSAVFFFSDHGDFTGNYGLVEKTQNTFEDVLTRVPLVIKPPRGTPIQPGVRDALVELVDFSATVEALTSIEPAHTHFGRSLLPLMAGETTTHRDAVFCEGGRAVGEVQAMELESWTDGDRSSLYWPRLALQQQEGPTHTKAVMCRTHDYKYVRRLYEQDELYDLRADPGECVNRIDDPALADVQRAMQDRLLDFLLATGDVVPPTLDRRW